MEYEYYSPDLSDLHLILKANAAALKSIQETNAAILAVLTQLVELPKFDENKKFREDFVRNLNTGLGGDYRGGSVRGLKGEREGGEKRGGKGFSNTPENESKNICQNDNPELLEEVAKLTEIIARNVSELEAKRLRSKQSLAQAATVYAKLLKQGYTNTHILQAVTDATNDQFWHKQFRSILKLTRKNGDGVLYIDVFLALRQKSHKLPQRAKIIV